MSLLVESTIYVVWCSDLGVQSKPGGGLSRLSWRALQMFFGVGTLHSKTFRLAEMGD